MPIQDFVSQLNVVRHRMTAVSTELSGLRRLPEQGPVIDAKVDARIDTLQKELVWLELGYKEKCR